MIPVRYRELDQERSVSQPTVALLRGNHWLLWQPTAVGSTGNEMSNATDGYWVRLSDRAAIGATAVWKFLDRPTIAGSVEAIDIISPQAVRLCYADAVAELTLDDQGLVIRATAPIRITFGLDLRPLGDTEMLGRPVTIFPRRVIHAGTPATGVERYLIAAELGGQSVQAELLVRGKVQRLSTVAPTARRWPDGTIQPLARRETFTVFGTELKFFIHDKPSVPTVSPRLSLKAERLHDFIIARLLAFRDQHLLTGFPNSAGHRFRDELMAFWLLNHPSITKLKLPNIKTSALRRYLAALDDWSCLNQPNGEAAADTFPWLVLALETITANEAHLLGESFRRWLRLHLRNGEQLRVPLGRTWVPGRERPRPLELEALFLQTLNRLAPAFKLETLRDNYRRRVRTHLITETYQAAELEEPTVFLAALIQPELLSPQKWEKLFDPILADRTTAWGGVAITTGDGHHSWHWLNNIIALALNQINPRKYHDQIEELGRVSLEELLSSGALGWPGERSSAEVLSPTGDVGSLLSAASLLRLLG